MCIEKAYGQLKRRFPLLKNGLRFRKISDSGNCIVAAVCIYNFLKNHNDELEEPLEANQTDDELEGNDEVDSTQGSVKRNEIAQTFV